MKISVDNNVVLELSEIQKKVIQNEIRSDIFDADMCRRLKHILEHKYEQCFNRLKNEWEPKLAERVESFPVDKDAFAQLIFDQPDYKNRSQRDADEVL